MSQHSQPPEPDWWAPWGAGESCRLWVGTRPLLISLPHDGTELPPTLLGRLQPQALALPDTDWFVGRLYDFARELGAYVLRPRYSRYLVDLNRPADGAALYPGRRETGLCPLIDFQGQPIYREGQEPEAAEIAERVAAYWQPYHALLSQTLAQLRARHGAALLWEGHSIVSRCPLFFDGRLPDYNLGTADGHSCAAVIEQALAANLARSGCSHIVNGRFRGGYITRHYGQPQRGVHAVQMEMAQASYMDEGPPWLFDSARARAAQAMLRELLVSALHVLADASVASD